MVRQISMRGLILGRNKQYSVSPFPQLMVSYIPCPQRVSAVWALAKFMLMAKPGRPLCALQIHSSLEQRLGHAWDLPRHLDSTEALGNGCTLAMGMGGVMLVLIAPSDFSTLQELNYMSQSSPPNSFIIN